MVEGWCGGVVRSVVMASVEESGMYAAAVHTSDASALDHIKLRGLRRPFLDSFASYGM